ncbi:MAG: serine/threonine-protein kinase [Pseudomonadota bacterium]
MDETRTASVPLGQDAEQLARVSKLLDHALELSPTELAPWLAVLAQAEAPVAAQLREMLAARDQPGFAGFLSGSMGLDGIRHERTAGDRLGAYELMRPLGRGGMAEVWLARRADGAFEREVAVKIPRVGHLSQGMIERFSRECRILATLETPGIARLYDAGVDADVPYIAMEYVPGEHINKWCDSRGLTTPARIALFLQVLEAVGKAHAQNVIHRDLKPSNILVNAAGEIRLLDFGVARLLMTETGGASLTRTYGRALTPEYASPEMLRGEPIDASSDIYSAGVVLFELLVGTRPGKRTTTSTQVLGNLPTGVREVLNKALAPLPEDRYADAADFAAALRTFAVPSGRRLRWWIAATAVAVLGGAGIWYLHGHGAASVAASAAATAPPTLAVLPFTDMSQAHDQEYLADGLAEELINKLTRIEGLRVTARTSAFSFKGKAQDLRNVGQQLGVAHILEGSVRKADGRLRITTQLIDVKTGYDIWSDTFDRTANDVFAIQDEIATTVARKLGTSLGVAATKDYGGTSSAEAYDHLLRGLSVFNKFTRESMVAAIGEYRAALAIDPGYARAAAELAIAMGAASASGIDITRREREEVTARANQLAPDASLTHVANMWLQSDRHEWIEADDSCSAVFKAGHDPRAEWICAGFLTLTGRVRAARPYREAARKEDPLSIVVSTTLARQYAILDMEPELRRELEHEDQIAGARRPAATEQLVYLAHSGASPAAMSAELERACPEIGKSACDIWTAAIRNPQTAPAQLRARLDSTSQSLPADAATIALAAAYLQDKALALDALQVFTARADSPAFQIMWYPLLGNVRKDARFKRILLNLGFVELWRHTGRWADFCHPVGTDDFECS